MRTARRRQRVSRSALWVTTRVISFTPSGPSRQVSLRSGDSSGTRSDRAIKGRCSSFAEPEETAVARARGNDPRDGPAAAPVAVDDLARARAQRQPSRRRYRATTAHALAYERASRPKPVFVLTHHARRPLEMRGGTTFRHRRLRRRL
jgi:hypothetical protein